MAKGISQAQVNTAADALVVAGERPTVERIRAFLGTGSPNTVTRLLEAWWQALGARLESQATKVALPDAPAEVASAASRLWEHALAAAQQQAEAAMATARSELAAEHAAVAEARARLRDEAGALRTNADEARQAQVLAEARLAEAHRLVDQQAAQLDDLGGQRDALQARLERTEGDHADLATRLQRQVAEAAAEREASAQHLRAAEDRAHAEVDRARQEAKTLQTQLRAQTREHTVQVQQLSRQRDEALATVAAAQRETEQQRGRADALAQQLAHLADLPATLQAALTQARDATGRRPARSTASLTGKGSRKPHSKRKPIG